MSVKVPDGWRLLGDDEVAGAEDGYICSIMSEPLTICEDKVALGRTGRQLKEDRRVNSLTFLRKVSPLVWRKEPPDTPGVWRQRYERRAIHNFDVTAHDIDTGIWKSRVFGNEDKYEFCRIADLPVIAEPTSPVQYRDVTIADLTNGPIECEVSDDGKEWKPVTCAGYIHEVSYPYIRKHSLGGTSSWKYARMPVDSAEKKPREWWLHIGGCGIDTPICKNALAYTEPQLGVSNLGGEQIHVREVLQ